MLKHLLVDVFRHLVVIDSKLRFGKNLIKIWRNRDTIWLKNLKVLFRQIS